MTEEMKQRVRLCKGEETERIPEVTEENLLPTRHSVAIVTDSKFTLPLFLKEANPNPVLPLFQG